MAGGSDTTHGSVHRVSLGENEVHGDFMIAIIYSCPSLVVPFLEELISRPFLDENRFRLVSQDRMSA